MQDDIFSKTLDLPLTWRKNGRFSVKDDNINVEWSEKSESSDEKSYRWKKKNVDPITGFKCKRFKVLFAGLISYEECHIFTNVNHLKNILREYKVKYRYHLKRYINKKQKVRAKYIVTGCLWWIHAFLALRRKTLMIKSLRRMIVVLAFKY